MAMNARTQVKKILGSKSFTGKQVAHLVLKDFLEARRGRPGVLSTTEVHRLKQGLRGSEVDVYNVWIRAFQLVDLSSKEAIIMSLFVEKRLHSLRVPMLLASLAEGEQALQSVSRPVLVTERQLQDIERGHREYVANRLEPFTDVLPTVAADLADEVSREYRDDIAGTIRELLYYAKFTEEDALPGIAGEEARALRSELFRTVVLRLLGWIEAGRLTPYALTKVELRKIEVLTQAFRGTKHASKLDTAKTLEAYEAEVGHRALKRAKPEETVALVKRIRDALEDGSLSHAQWPKWLDAVFFRGQDLVAAGPSWYAWWADHFETDRHQGYALVLNPRSSQVDENGHFIEPTNALLPGATRQDALSVLDDRAGDLYDAVAEAHTIVRRQLRHVLGYQAVIQAVSEAIGVDLGRDVEQALSSLASTVDDHNELLESVSGWHRLEGLSALRLDTEALKPSRNTLDSIRECLSRNQDEDWWSDVAGAMNRELEAAEPSRPNATFGRD